MQNTARLTDYLDIRTADDLNRYSARLIQDPKIEWLAIDTEFVRTDTYFPELSLVQIQDCLGEVALIDPLAIQQEGNQGALAGLVKILTEPGLLKVFHSARQDIEVLYQLAHTMPVSIFDTQIAAIFFKHGDSAGFARVVEAELGHVLPKTQTRTNWHERPLSNEQLEYAIDDVRYLAPLYQKMRAQLQPDQLNAIAQECDILLDEALYKPNPEQAGDKIKGTRGFKPKQLAIVYALAAWRERYAIEHNQPKKWVLSDEVIVDIAKRPPKTVEALYKVPQIKASSVKQFGPEWIACLDQVFASAPESWPQPPAKPTPPNAQEEVLLNLCFSVAQQIALDFRLNPHNLLTKNELLEVLRTPEADNLIGWRGLLIAQPIRALLSGNVSLCIENSSLHLTPHSL